MLINLIYKYTHIYYNYPYLLLAYTHTLIPPLIVT